MFKKNWVNFILVIVGLVLVIYAFYLTKIISMENTGIMFGVGSSLFGVGFALIISNIYNKCHPEVLKWKNTQVNDERNKLLHYKAYNTTGKISRWLVFVLAAVTILVKLPIWITLTLVSINLIDSFLYVYFFNKYSKEM